MGLQKRRDEGSNEKPIFSTEQRFNLKQDS